MENNTIEETKDLLTELFISQINKQDTSTLIKTQHEIIERLDKTNLTFKNILQPSQDNLNAALKDFNSHINVLKNMKKDLDSIFKRIRDIQEKLLKKYPETYEESKKRNKVILEEDEEDEEEFKKTLGAITEETLDLNINTEEEMDGGLDVDELFRRFDVKELKNIEGKIKIEIEKKKEELRMMVYDRYRDIIDAADAIHTMKSYSKKIENVLDELQANNELLQLSSSLKVNKNSADQDKKKNIKYVLAVIVKVLQNSPNKIWYHLDNNEYLEAAIQFLFAQHVHVCMELEKTFKEERNYLNYGNQLWNSTKFLKNTIIIKSKESFNLNATSHTLKSSIMAIILLENASLESIYKNYLEIRIRSIVGKLDNSSNDDLTVKDRIINCLSTFSNTINNIHDVFFDQCVVKDGNSMKIESDLKLSYNSIELFKKDGFVIHKIPSYLQNFDNGNFSVIRLSLEYLLENAKIWLEKCLGEIKVSLSNALKYTQSLKNLKHLREAIFDFINKNCSIEISNWSDVFKCLFNKQEFNIWNELISKFYYQQAQEIIKNYFKNAHENLINSLKLTINSITSSLDEIDLNNYLWYSSDEERSSVKSLSKTKSVTPALEKLYISINNDITKIIDDLDSSSNQDDLFNDDGKYFCEYMQIHSFDFSENIIRSCLEIVENLSTDIEETKESIDKLVTIGRFLYSLESSCPRLKELHVENRLKKKLSQSPLANSIEIKTSNQLNDKWNLITAKINDLNHKIIRIWIEDLVSNFKDIYVLSKMDSGSVESLLENILAWGEIEIEDELETGKQVKSKISVPMSFSPLVQQFLYGCCQQVIKRFPYTMIHLLTKELGQCIYQIITEIFKEKINFSKEAKDSNKYPIITQNNALQMIFDLKYLNLLFDVKENTSSDLFNEYKLIYSDLETFIDPFDFDILTPFIQSNVNKAFARTSSLFGVINMNDRFLRNTNQQMISNEMHNVILLSQNVPRFEMLPISSLAQNNASSTFNESTNLNLLQKKSDKNESSRDASQATSKDSGVSAFYKKWF